MPKKYKIIIAVLALIAISQYAAIKLVYAHKLTGPGADWLAKLYSLKAGVIEKDGESLPIYLTDYFANQQIATKFLEAQVAQGGGQSESISPADIDLIIWDKLVKDAWLNDVSEKNDIIVSDEEVDDYVKNFYGEDKAAVEASAADYGLSLDEYKDLVISPFIREAKVYENVLKSYGDVSGVQRAEAAYSALEAGDDFMAVGKNFSDDQTYVENTMWLPEEDLVDFYAPIKDLKVSGFSQIVTVPGAYIIWYLESIGNDDSKTAREVRAIFINAKSIDEFLADFLVSANVKRLY